MVYQDINARDQITEQNIKIYKTLIKIYVILTFIYIPIFLIYSCIIVKYNNNGKFYDYSYYHIYDNKTNEIIEHKLTNIVSLYSICGLGLSVIMCLRIILAPINMYIIKYKYTNICIYYLWHVLCFIENISHIEIISPVITFILFIFALYYNYTCDNYKYYGFQQDKSYEYRNLLVWYIIMVFVLCIISIINLLLGNPFDNYHAYHGSYLKKTRSINMIL
jgi:heme/copper-type cytochrome/quinol oxidase subunit 2